MYRHNTKSKHQPPQCKPPPIPSPFAHQTLLVIVALICGIHTTRHPTRTRNPHRHFGYNGACLPKPSAALARRKTLMLICNPYEIVIQGITRNGKTFRPSDWSERLCGILSSFDQGHRLAYHQWVRPILVDNVRCVAVDRKLEQINESMFHFLMDFAHDNDLRIVDCKALLEEHGDNEAPVALEDALQQQEAQTAAEAAAPAALAHEIREIDADHSKLAFAAMLRLRPHIGDAARFAELVAAQRAEGYRMLGVFEEGKQNAVAVCGFRISHNFASGRYLNIDDLVTSDDATRQGYAGLLLEHIKTVAAAENCRTIHTDSLVGQIRSDAHRLYLKHGFTISCHHFSWQAGQ